MPGFITLELQGNPLEPVHGLFLSSKTLIYLDISNCGLNYLNSDFFSNISALTTLDLSGNPLAEISNSVFEPLNSLETLRMNNCNLSHISDNVFKNLTYLRTLELAENILVNIDWPVVFGHLIRLEMLDLRNSSVTNLPENSFNNNDYIRTLLLGQNKLSGYDVASSIGQKLHELETLDLSYCNLDNPLSEDAFSNSTKLRVLILSGNSLFASDLLVALAPLVELQKLSLSNCGLSQLPDTFHKFKSLQELDISHNPLNDVFIRLISPIETLEYLNMGYSNLSYVSPTSFSKMTSMKRLVLSGNDLYNLEAGLFAGLTRLESLELNNCGLQRSLNATLFFNNLTYTDITELQLAGNPLQVAKEGPLLPKQLSRLQILDLNNCNLTFLPFEAFFWTRNITHISLLGNRLSRVSDDSFGFLKLLPQLKMLDLRYNNLTQLLPKDLSLNPQIEKLKLIGNPWKCDCSVAELWDWAQLQKGSLNILEGTTVDQEQITAGKNKKKKLLVCNYDASVQMPLVMNRTVTGRRPFIKSSRILTSTNRTWAKYVRESGCEPKTELKRSIRSLTAMSLDELAAKSNSPNNWSFAAITALSVYFVVMAILGLVYFAMPSQHNLLRRRALSIHKQN